LVSAWSKRGGVRPLPRPPWPRTQRKISHSPDPPAPKVGGVPQSQHFLQPHFSNHAKLAEMSDTFSIGVTCFAFMPPKDSTAIKAAPEKARPRGSPCAGGGECLTLGFRGRYSLLHFLFHASGFLFARSSPRISNQTGAACRTARRQARKKKSPKLQVQNRHPAVIQSGDATGIGNLI